MTLRDALRTARGGLLRNRMRSLLTTLGIVIGVTAVILVMAMSRGAGALILEQVQGVGSQTVIVRAGQEPRGPSDVSELFTDSLKAREVRAILDPARVPGVAAVAPTVITSATISYEGETHRSSVIGTDPAFLSIFRLTPPTGRFLSDEEVRSRAHVAVIGTSVKSELFGESDALGATIRIKNRGFRVIGVFPPIGQAGVFDIDDLAIVPNATAQEFLLGTKHFNAILVRAESEALVQRVARDIRLTLRELHDISDPAKDDFFVATQADLVRIIGNITTVLTVLLVSIAAISLLVGGIGIMNVMLVSVTERTREIGLRKAVGATTKDILTQFLLEAVLLTALGGFIGTLLGGLLAFAASRILRQQLEVEWTFVMPWSAVALGIGVASGVGVLFGLYPARAAALKNPIEALRHE